MNEEKIPIKCHNCREPLELTMNKCPKCGSKDRDVAIEDEDKGEDVVNVARSVSAIATESVASRLAMKFLYQLIILPKVFLKSVMDTENFATKLKI